MAFVYCSKLKNAARYVGQYLRSYVDLSRAFFAGTLAAKYVFNQQSIEQVVHFLVNGVIENVGQTQNAWKNEPDARGHRPQRAVDVTISLDKSISVTFVLCASHRDALFELAKAAIERVLAALEERCAVARAGPDAHLVRGHWAGLVVPEFTNRNGEIQIHFHVVLFIAIECNDGVVRSMDTRPLFAHAKWAGIMLTAELTRSLREYGFGAETRDGRIEIEGIPQALCDKWSSRREEVLDYGKEHGLTTAKELHRAALASRGRKHRDEPLDAVLTRHEAEARELGYDPLEIERLCFARKHELRPTNPDTLDEIAARIQAAANPRGVREFEQQIAAEAPRLGLGIDGVLEAARRAMQRLGGRLDEVARDLDRRNLEASLTSLNGRPGVAATRAAREHAAEKHVLAPRHRDALEILTSKGSGARVVDVSDPYERRLVLAALRDALRRSGIDAVAVTLRRSDADALREATGLLTFTVSTALREWARAREPRLFENPADIAFRKIGTAPIQDTLAWAFGLRTRREIEWRSWQRDRQPLDLADGSHVLVVDEAHTIPDRLLAAVLDEAKSLGATVVLSADLQRAPHLAALAPARAIASLREPARTQGESELEAFLRMLRDTERRGPPDPFDLGMRR